MATSPISTIISGITTLLTPLRASEGGIGYVRTLKTFAGASSQEIISALEPNPPAIIISWGGDNTEKSLDETGALFPVTLFFDIYMFVGDQRGKDEQIVGAGTHNKGLAYLYWDVFQKLKGQRITSIPGCQPNKSGYIDLSGEGKILEIEDKTLAIYYKRIAVDIRIIA